VGSNVPFNLTYHTTVHYGNSSLLRVEDEGMSPVVANHRLGMTGLVRASSFDFQYRVAYHSFAA
jgi:hypothetical protein